MKQKKLLTMLVLLLMAATGAVAQVAITTDLADSYDAKVGIPITLSIEASNAQYYQWYKKLPQADAMIVGATSSSYTFTPKEAGETKFFCKALGYNKDYAESKVTIVKATVPQTYSITLQEGTEDAGNWSVPAEAAEGSPVTVTYSGEKKVKSVKAVKKGAAIIDLSTLTADYEAQDGDVLTGETTSYKVTIAAGATVTLDGVNISSSGYCIKCAGDATIILKDGSTNTLTGTGQDYPALSIGDANTTLTIQGSTGVLNVTSGNYCAGIGGGYKNANKTCGNIRIEGGVITAQGGQNGAGIGTDSGPATCGDIIITGGTITAKGGSNAAGIGTGYGSSDPAVCGDITIANTVTKVTATKGEYVSYSIGKGYGYKATCGTVTIGGTKYWENNAAVNGGDTYLAQSPLIYDPSAPAEEPVTLATPLTIEAITAGTIRVNIGTLKTDMKYSVNGGTKTTINSTTTIEGLKAGDKVQFYGNGTGNTVNSDVPEVKISGGTAEVKVYGNIMSLLDEEGFATKTDLQNYAFFGLFLENTTLIDASELLLPAATLAPCCYQQMFQGCTALTKAPKLPATTLKSYCYYYMFYGCTSLASAPELPATWLAMSCYAQMFSGCTSLTTAYVKAAYKNESDECYNMFYGCTATDAVLHTTSGNKASWETMMGTGKDWDNWTVAGDWQE